MIPPLYKTPSFLYRTSLFIHIAIQRKMREDDVTKDIANTRLTIQSMVSE